jgi:hypothetical protein
MRMNSLTARPAAASGETTPASIPNDCGTNSRHARQQDIAGQTKEIEQDESFQPKVLRLLPGRGSPSVCALATELLRHRLKLGLLFQ